MKRIECEGVGDNDGFFELHSEVSSPIESVINSATKRYQIDGTDGEWFVYDHHDCFCCAGPMTEESAIALQIELNNKAAC